MTDLTPEEKKRLRSVAEAATEGPWKASYSPEWGGTVTSGAQQWPDGTDYSVCDGPSDADGTHIATFDPPTVLALLDAHDRLAEQLAIAVEALGQMGTFRSRSALARIAALDPKEDPDVDS